MSGGQAEIQCNGDISDKSMVWANRNSRFRKPIGAKLSPSSHFQVERSLTAKTLMSQDKGSCPKSEKPIYNSVIS